MSDTTPEQRQKFEAWFLKERIGTKADLYIKNGDYFWNETRLLFFSWQAATAQAVPQWLPIKSCPKDGMDFLASDGSYFEVLNEPPGCALGVWAELTPGEWAGSSVTHTVPTHWMPLPAPPVGKGDE